MGAESVLRPATQDRLRRRQIDPPGCSTPGAAMLVSAPSRPLWCLQLPGLQLVPRATIGPARLRCAACALVANLGTGSLVARPPWFRDSAGTAPDGCWAIAGDRNHGNEIVRFGGLPLLVGRHGDCRVRCEDRRTFGPGAKCSPHPELRARRAPSWVSVDQHRVCPHVRSAAGRLHPPVSPSPDPQTRCVIA